MLASILAFTASVGYPVLFVLIMSESGGVPLWGDRADHGHPWDGHRVPDRDLQTLATIAAGNRLRLTLSTTDTPHLTPLPGQLPELTGGV